MQLFLIRTNNRIHLMKVDNWLWYRAVQLLCSIKRWKLKGHTEDSDFSQKASRKFWTWASRINKGCFSGDFRSHMTLLFQWTCWLYMGNVKAKINQRIRLVQITTCFTSLLTLLKITALPWKQTKKSPPQTKLSLTTVWMSQE